MYGRLWQPLWLTPTRRRLPEIPTVIGRRAETVNRNQLFHSRRDYRVSVLLPLSDVNSTNTPSCSLLPTPGLSSTQRLEQLAVSSSLQRSTCRSTLQPIVSPLSISSLNYTLPKTARNNVNGEVNISISVNSDEDARSGLLSNNRTPDGDDGCFATEVNSPTPVYPIPVIVKKRRSTACRHSVGQAARCTLTRVPAAPLTRD